MFPQVAIGVRWLFGEAGIKGGITSKHIMFSSYGDEKRCEKRGEGEEEERDGEEEEREGEDEERNGEEEEKDGGRKGRQKRRERREGREVKDTRDRFEDKVHVVETDCYVFVCPSVRLNNKQLY